MKIKNLNSHRILLEEDKYYYPPEGFVVDYADDVEGIISFASESGKYDYRFNSRTKQIDAIWIPSSYGVKLTNFRII